LKSGFVHDLDFEAYKAEAAMSVSSLSLIRHSPKLFRHVVLEKNRKPASKAQDVGTAVHAAVLEPEKFSKTYARLDPALGSTRINVVKNYLEEMRSQGKIMLPQDDWDTVVGCHAAIQDYRVARALLQDAKSEVSFFFQQLGVPCKARADALNVDLRYVVDLKTTKSADKFENSIGEYGYHRQAAWYLDGIKEITGQEWTDWYWLVVETEAPFTVRVMRADPGDLELGRHENHEALMLYRKCMEKNVWPDRDGGKIVTARLPDWYKKRQPDVLFKALK
jgi:hypothetical protein